MAEHPIIFSGEMVRAILDLRKRQTRRILNRIAGIGKVTEFGPSDTPGYDWIFRDAKMRWNDLTHADLLARCPYGQPGDTLWVREGFRVAGETHEPDHHVWGAYLADDLAFEIDYSEVTMGRIKLGKTYPSIHMPRWACRTERVIAGVRIERVQDISEEDARAEGVAYAVDKLSLCDDGTMDSCTQIMLSMNPQKTFEWLWDSINLKRGHGWDQNDWVWAVTFKRKDTP